MERQRLSASFLGELHVLTDHTEVCYPSAAAHTLPLFGEDTTKNVSFISFCCFSFKKIFEILYTVP